MTSGTTNSSPVSPQGLTSEQSPAHRAEIGSRLTAREKAAEAKMKRQQEKQARAEAAKEAKKQRALIAAQERQDKREQQKILKEQEKMKRVEQLRLEKELRAQQIHQEKMKRLEQLRVEKELRAQQIYQEKMKRLEQRRVEKELRAQRFLEEKRQKKEAAAVAKQMEAEKRLKEKELRQQEAFILKCQEKERRKQLMILMKAAEAQKKAEEKERLKKEKEDERQQNKKRKLELRRLEREKAKELEKPIEDLCLADHKPLPELSRIPGLALSGSTFADCLMVLEFLHRFGKALGLGFENSSMLTMNDLQEGLLNIGESMSRVQDLLINMLSAVMRDPGMPASRKSKTVFGNQLTHVEINRDNVSEILQLYMEAHCQQKKAAVSLKNKAFQAHSPSQKASMLGFLVNELCSSKAVTSEINKSIDSMTILRKDKQAVERKLHKLRSVHAKKRGEKDSSVQAEDVAVAIPNIRKRKRKAGGNEDEEDEYEDGYNQGVDVMDDEEVLRENTANLYEEEAVNVDQILVLEPRASSVCIQEDTVHSASTEELEEEIEKEYKQKSQIRKKMLDSSHCLRSETIGQDRYKRRYWVLPHCDGVLIEGLASYEGSEEIEEKEPKAAAGTPRLPFSGTSPSPLLDHGSQKGEGDGNKENCCFVNKSKTSAIPSDSVTAASFPAVDVIQTLDNSIPQSIPEEMRQGWWTLSDKENLQSLAQALHSRGIREKVLQQKIHKHMEDMALLSENSKAGITLTTAENQELCKEMVEDWCVEEHAMKVDIALLQQVEALERSVVAAGLQVKGWMHPEPQSHREDLVYHEHKPSSYPLLRRPNNPLDIAVTRLAELERHIKPSREEEELPGMRLWHEAVGQVHGSGQLSLCIQQLEKSIPWGPTIVQWHCQFCRTGDNEDQLLLCDSCDRGCHTYCHRPKIFTVPEGDWLCPSCIRKESGPFPRNRRRHSRTAGGASVGGELISEEDVMPKKESRKRKRDDSSSTSQSKYDSAVSHAKKTRPS